MLASTLSRPRWAMPSTASVMPGVAASSSTASRTHDGRLRPFEAEALLPHVAGVEEALERLRRVQPVEDVALLARVEGGGQALGVLLDPPLLLRVLDVHVLDAERAAVGVAQDVERLAQGRGSRPARPSTTN